MMNIQLPLGSSQQALSRLFQAAEAGDTASIRQLVAGGSVNIRAMQEAATIAAEHNHLAALQLLCLSLSTPAYRTMISRAMNSQASETAAWLIKKADPLPSGYFREDNAGSAMEAIRLENNASRLGVLGFVAKHRYGLSALVCHVGDEEGAQRLVSASGEAPSTLLSLCGSSAARLYLLSIL